MQSRMNSMWWEERQSVRMWQNHAEKNCGCQVPTAAISKQRCWMERRAKLNSFHKLKRASKEKEFTTGVHGTKKEVRKGGRNSVKKKRVILNRMVKEIPI